VILETSAEAFAIADMAKALGHEVRVVPSALAPSLGVGARKIKTDKRDAQILSEVSSQIDLQSVHIPSDRARELKAICALRETLVESRTKLINSVRGFCRTRLIPIVAGSAETFSSRAQRSFAKVGIEVPPHVERVLLCLTAITVQIREADKDLRNHAKTDATCKRLMTVPGIGPVTAVRFQAALDEPTRFPDAHAVESYLGVTPGEDSSSERKRRTSITKAGPRKLRWALVEAAWCAWRFRPDDPMIVWAKEVAKRRGRRIAITALARKMAGILYAIWRSEKPYDPKRGASQSKEVSKE
jgi:transposase